MKKIYTTAMVLLILGVGVAQKEMPVRTVKMVTPYQESNTYQHQYKKKMNTSKAERGTYYINYVEALYEYGGGKIEILPLLVFGDTNHMARYRDTCMPAQNLALAQVFDLRDPVWDDLYSYSPNPYPRIDSIFSLKRVTVAFEVNWGTLVPEDVVDTAVITVLATKNITYELLGPYQQPPSFNWPEILMTHGAHGSTPKIDFSKYSGIAHKKYEIKCPITYQDSYQYLGDYHDTYEFELEGEKAKEFEKLSSDYKVVVAITFKTSIEHDIRDTLGVQLNSFFMWYTDDTRKGYLENDNGSEELLSETSTSLCVHSHCFNRNSAFYQTFAHNKTWIAPYRRPEIGIEVDYWPKSGVKEVASKNISVKPNPATNNFTLTLADAGSAQVELFNLVGQKIYETTTTEQTVNVNVSDLNNGLYMLRVTQNGKIYTSKVVVR